MWSHARAALEVTVRPSTRSNFTCQRNNNNNNNINNHSINQPWSSSPRSVRDASTTSFLPIVGRRRLHDRPSDTKVGTQKTNKMASCRVASESRNGPRPKNRNVRDATARPMSFQSLNVQKRRNNQRKKKREKKTQRRQSCSPVRARARVGRRGSTAASRRWPTTPTTATSRTWAPCWARCTSDEQKTHKRRRRSETKKKRPQSIDASLAEKVNTTQNKKPIEPGDDRV